MRGRVLTGWCHTISFYATAAITPCLVCIITNRRMCQGLKMAGIFSVIHILKKIHILIALSLLVKMFKMILFLTYTFKRKCCLKIKFCKVVFSALWNMTNSLMLNRANVFWSYARSGEREDLTRLYVFLLLSAIF